MRRIFALTVLPVLAAVTLVGCGSSSPSASQGANAAVTASGKFGTAPSVTIPKEKASSALAVKTLIHGSGTTISKTDSFLSNFNMYVWSGTTHKLLDSTYPDPQVLPVSLLPGIQKAVAGEKVGSRVLAVIPPKDGYGSTGNSQLGVTGKDTLVFVMDLLGTYPAAASASGTQMSSGGGSLPTVSAAHGTAPSVTIPKTSPPSTLVAQTLIKGTGPTVTKGDTVVVQYTLVDWRTPGKVLQSTWQHKVPFSFQIGSSPSQVIPGWDKGLIGKTVGSRVLLVVPPADAYGKTGQPQAGIRGTDTLVFVVDIIGALSPSRAG